MGVQWGLWPEHPEWPLPGRWVGVSALASPPLPQAREVEPAHPGWKPAAWVVSVRFLYWLVRDGVFPAISVNKAITAIIYSSPPKVNFLTPRAPGKENEGCGKAVVRLHHCLWWALKETQDVKRRRTLTPVSWDACERNDFSGPRLLHLPICRKVLISLRYLVFFNSQK